MKKQISNIIICTAILCVFTLSSCKKDYVCECVTTTTSFLGDPTTATTTQKLEKMKEKDAIEKCDAGDTESNLFIVSSKTECEIK